VRGRHCSVSSATPLNTPKEPSFKSSKRNKVSFVRMKIDTNEGNKKEILAIRYE